MALRNQPYLPLYVQDFLSDEKLNECSAESTGVYIRLMCLLHKSETYGSILLRQKDKQNENKIADFAVKLSRQMPYTVDVIKRSLEELLEENVIQLNGDSLSQRRMVKDGKLSDIRASARRGKAVEKQKSEFSSDFDTNFVATKTTTNTENENEYEIDNENGNENSNKKEIQSVIDAWNSIGVKQIRAIVENTDRYTWLKRRIKDYGLESVLKAVENVKASDFLMGRTKEGFDITFDWFIRPNNFPKVLDGNYENHERRESGGGNQGFSQPTTRYGHYV